MSDEIEEIKDEDTDPMHECFACGRPHDGYEAKYCETCGKAWQERQTYREALRRILFILKDPDKYPKESAIRLAEEALVVGPMGERLDTGVHPDFPSPYDMTEQERAEVIAKSKKYWEETRGEQEGS
jgi:hypothetical protein